ncbi:hypothetical protein EU805_01205 [Salipiger sp. IMCC34102]|uniref:hypothetical protein n=1 Tax=Salipiger sp. IMCC34102 TaxID=2510647 RepID=UPI00101B92D3|nr:hypothetical protein [Salipiger sp. IMCC34102]RYH04018.1 hypothetical protein EU805_01205 [Salipiger sp. IMCC34102]
MTTRLWCRCNAVRDRDLAVTLHDALTDEGDQIDLLVTGDGGTANPTGRRETRQFIAQEHPSALVWLGGPLDLGALQAAAETALPTVLVNMAEDALTPLGGFFQRGRVRTALSSLAGVYTRDSAAAAAFRQAGAVHVYPAAVLEPSVTVLPYAEADRVEMAEALNSRSVWMACGVRAADVPQLAEAHQQATRRSHRLLLVVEAADPDEGEEIARRFGERFLQTGRARLDPVPQEAEQVHVADTPGSLGLWLRLASVTLAGGTMAGGVAQDPFEIATLGSGLLHGPRTAPHAARYERLGAAGATRQVADWAELGGAIEDLLAADTVARMVTAGWDVTSRGAQTANAIAALLLDRLDRVA